MSTRRCSERRFLLRAGKRTNQAVLYALGYASQVHGVELHACLVMSNHHHTMGTDHLGMLPDFHQSFHQLVAKSMNVNWGRWEAFWSSGQTSVVVQSSPEDAFKAMIYALTNPVRAHLVERAIDWPGVSSLEAQLLGKEIVVRRPHWFYDPDGEMPKTVTLRFTRLPGFEHLTHEEWAAKIKAAVAAVEEQAAKERAGRRVVGRKALLAQSAFDSPKTAAPRRKLSPTIAAKNKHRRIHALEGRARWLEEYRRAYEAYRKRHPEGSAGTRKDSATHEDKIAFPHGVYELRIRHGVLVAPGPGPLPIPYAATLVAA
jgi:hypothetical protein